jgi:hypothetical protein
MSDKQDEKLEKMLRSRRTESASPDLAQRIILQARQMPQLQPLTLAQWLRGLFSEFHLPKPAYVLVGTLLMGIVVGLNTPVETADKEDLAPVNVQSFLYADEAIL